MKDFKFELKKFILNKKNRYILVLISAIIVGYSTYATISFTSLFSNNTASLLQDVQDNEKSVQDNIKNNEDILKDAKTSAARDQLNDTLNYYKEQNIIYEKQVTALNANHINEYFRLQKKVDQLLLNAENGQDKALKQEIKYITTVQERHLNFEVMASMQSHAFGNFHQQFIPILSSSLFIVLFSSMISILVASGYESKENRFYRFAGIDLRKNLLIKVLSGTLATFAWILLSSIVYFLIIGVVNGFGAWNYPAYLGNVDFMRFTLTNITIANGILDLGSVFYLFFVILFLASLGALISVFVKRSMVVVGVIALFVMGYSMIGKVSWIISIKRFIPFSYFEPLKLFGNPTDLFGRYSLVVGASYLFVLSALFLSISIFVLKNQKIRSV
ncbi:ABC transporter permease [Lactococcus hircilactis]|uniref:ABC transporter permease n=1 Tax=Lactococcus hircilactis TaxID=1494462 RepID=A0A7X1ZAM5_9LACT|nr:ABC transporter permease [Lactococcus hircilactis]MQW39752.1 ABC transporter permease [Lactococcus hircilactis]